MTSKFLLRGAAGRVGVFAAALAMSALGLSALGCGSDDSGSGGGSGTNPGGEGTGGDLVAFPNIQWSPAQLEFNAAAETGTQVVTVLNSGAREMRVDSIDLQYTPLDAAESPPAFTIREVRARSAGETRATFRPEETDFGALSNLMVGNTNSNSEFTSLEIDIVYTRPVVEGERSGTLVIASNSDANPVVTIPIGTSQVAARIEVTPLVLNFDGVGQGESETRFINVNNAGSGLLEVRQIEFQGSDYFRLEIDGAEYLPGGTISLDPPIQVSTVESLQFIAHFAPAAADPVSATVRIRSNDSTEPPDGTLVELNGNLNGPCIALTPAQLLNFGPRQVGVLSDLPVDITNCGNADLVISEIAVLEGSHPAFAVDYSTIGPDGQGEPYGADNPLLEGASPLVIPINSKRTVRIRYVPLAESPLDDNDSVIPDIGTVLFKNNSFEAERLLEVRGVGIDLPCPWPIIEIAQGEEVIPQTMLNLDGSGSFSGAGAIVQYQWSVAQPTGSGSFFNPSPNVVNPTFEVNVAGEYTFQLDVWDDTNTQSCEPAEATVLVIPDEAIHVELVWNTPAVPDQSGRGQGGPGSGADLDLHFVHPFAGGPDFDGDGKPDGWFDVPFDCFWFNPTPVWGSQDPSVDDNPRLDRDDTTGPGPENLNFNGPENGRTYRVGVHYWNDHGFGESYATVFVYIFSQLVWSQEQVKLFDLDMWEACSITWDPNTPVVTTVANPAGHPKITPNYKNPFF